MISVIIYSHKNKSYLEQSLVTLSQQECDWEAIVIDDGFSISKPRVPRNIASKVRVIDTQKPVGFLRAIAMGLALVRGDRCVIQRGCDCHTADRLETHSKILDSVYTDLVFDTPRILTDTGAKRLECFDIENVHYRSTTTLLEQILKEKFVPCFGCVAGFMFKVKAFNIEQLHRRLHEEVGKSSLTFAVNTLYKCLPEQLFQSKKALSIVNYKTDVEVFENNDYGRICSYHK